jgi:hypothetical protein
MTQPKHVSTGTRLSLGAVLPNSRWVTAIVDCSLLNNRHRSRRRVWRITGIAALSDRNIRRERKLRMKMQVWRGRMKGGSKWSRMIYLRERMVMGRSKDRPRASPIFHAF